MMHQVSSVRQMFDARKMRQIRRLDLSKYQGVDAIERDLAKLGINLRAEKFGFGADSLQPALTQASVAVPIQFLQYWLPNAVEILTAVRNIDKLVGLSVTGDWCDEQVVQKFRELSGTALPYDDYNQLPYSDWNVNFLTRTIVRFEIGIRVSILEAERAAKMRENPDKDKRDAATKALEIIRNSVGFYGFNNGNNLTYGLLNDPGMPAYVTAATGAGGSTTWASKTYLEIQADIRQMAQGLMTASQGNIDPLEAETTLAIPTSTNQFMTVGTDFGYSITDWISKSYPRMRIVTCPEFENAEANQNVAYLYAENVSGMSETWKVLDQWVPTKFRNLGVQQEVKSYTEAYSNATAGTVCLAGYGIYRLLGI
jgi:hypothetical protein